MSKYAEFLKRSLILSILAAVLSGILFLVYSLLVSVHTSFVLSKETKEFSDKKKSPSYIYGEMMYQKLSRCREIGMCEVTFRNGKPIAVFVDKSNGMMVHLDGVGSAPLEAILPAWERGGARISYSTQDIEKIILRNCVGTSQCKAIIGPKLSSFLVHSSETEKYVQLLGSQGLEIVPWEEFLHHLNTRRETLSQYSAL